MTEVVYNQDDGDPVVVNLRDPYLAAILAWLLPGAGHFYQRRYFKGFLFLACVLTTFLFGLGLGGGRVVYASFKSGDVRWQYICQLGVGAAAMPAIAQNLATKDGSDPYFVLCERYAPVYRYERNYLKLVNSETAYLPIPADSDYTGERLIDGFMAPPAGQLSQNDNDVLGQWHKEFKHNFEMGTLFTVIAGLLNLLAIYDAFCGPAILTTEQREKMEEKKNRKKRKRRKHRDEDSE